MGKVVLKNKSARIVENKNGTRSTYTSYKTQNGTKWHKTGGVSTSRSRKKS